MNQVCEKAFFDSDSAAVGAKHACIYICMWTLLSPEAVSVPTIEHMKKTQV